ncbi:hypothetical protein FRC08_000600 [Ceratobasidium sp. 394]|nr:hypothetical protein FRC08_000600 [Ceratobasidium sp. 394]
MLPPLPPPGTPTPKKHNVWGPRIDEYFSKDPFNSFFPKGRPIPTIQHVKTVAIPHLERLALHGQPSSETCQMLWGILSLLHHPKELRCLGNTTLLKGCIRGLRSYTNNLQTGGYELFTYEFGFLCFRVIVMLVQVGILVHTNTFEKSLQNSGDPETTSLSLSACASAITANAKEKKNSREWLFGASKSKNGNRTLLGSMGGVEGVDVTFFVKAIWRSRAQFSVICTRVISTGWSFVLLILGEHLRWALEDGIKDEYEYDWVALQMLCFRYIFVAPSPIEIFLLTDICTTGEMYRQSGAAEMYDDAFMHEEDAQFLMESFINRMTPLPHIGHIPSIIAKLLVRFITMEEVMLQFDDLMPSFLKAAYSWIWVEITRSSAKSLSENNNLLLYAIPLVEFTGLLYRKAQNADNAAQAFHYTHALFEIDFVNLLGRLMLAPMVAGSTLPPDSDSIPSDGLNIGHNWKLLTKEIYDFNCIYITTQPKYPDRSVAESYFDWLNTWRGIEAQNPQHIAKPRWFKEHFEICRRLWATIGSGFGYRKRSLNGDSECAYTRCPGVVPRFGAEFACSRCLRVVYCSRRCQHAHWQAATPDAHRKICSRFEGVFEQTDAADLVMPTISTKRVLNK